MPIPQTRFSHSIRADYLCFLADEVEPLLKEQKALIEEGIKVESITANPFDEIAMGIAGNLSGSSYCLYITLIEIFRFAEQMSRREFSYRCNALSSRCRDFYRKSTGITL